MGTNAKAKNDDTIDASTEGRASKSMLSKIARLFVIKNRFEAFLIIYALALGATSRGATYMEQYPGLGGQLLFLAATGAVFLGGAAILDGLKAKQELAELKAQMQQHG
ncbi:MAG: hypothetical protein AAF127_11175 [Pseudomonadota bacterium]